MATTLPTQQKSLLLLQKQGDFAVQTTPVPTAGPGELLVEIHSTALNPVDWKIQAYGTVVEHYPAVLGSDCAGVVKQVGEGVTEFAVGDKVVHQGYYDNRRATFQQYTIVPAEIAAKIPPNLTFDEASTIPVTLAATAGGLYNEKRVPIGGAGLTAPWEAGGRGKYTNQPILIMGGSSSVGQHAIQLAKLSGFSPIITTASVRHTEYLKSLGAAHVFDRDDATLRSLGSAVKAITQEPVKVAYDAISLPETQNAAYDVLADGGQIVLVTSTIAVDEKKLAGSNKEIVKVWGNVHLPVYRSLGISMYKHLTSLLEVGDIKPNRIELVPGGLVGIPAALNKLKAGVSAMKFVARPQETPEE